METVLKDVDLIYAVIDSMTDLVRMVDKDGIVLLANKAMVEAVGGCVGRKCYRCLSLTDRCSDCLRIRAKAGEEGLETERRIGDRIYSVKAEPVWDSAGEYLGVVEVFRDSTDTVRLRTQIMESNVRMLRDMQMARAMQHTMLRSSMPDIQGYKLSFMFHPCDQVGGDMFEVVKLTDGRQLMFIGDVSGHGVQAAMLTVFLRSEVASAAKRTSDLSKLAQMLLEAFEELNLGGDMYITAFLAALDPASGELECMNMGHSVPPLIFNGERVCALRIAGLPICTWGAAFKHDTKCEKLERGGRLMLYTDGLFETESSLKKLTANFAETPFDAEEMLAGYDALAAGCRDDLFMIVIERL